MMDLEQARNPAQVETIYVHPDRLLPHLLRIANRQRLGRVTPLAALAPPALAPGRIQAVLNLFAFQLTVGTFHCPSLLHPLYFSHSHLTGRLHQTSFVAGG
jgi:hypothetical protein